MPEYTLLYYKKMRKIDVKDLKDNFFEVVGKEWMLVTAGTIGKYNTMTASWGCIGRLWNKPVAVVFIRPERFTHEFVESNNGLTLSFLGNTPEARKIYNFCGSKSGRDFDKVKETGLVPVELESGNVAFGQARLVLDCRKLYKDDIKPGGFIDPEIAKWYGGANGGYHDMYVLEIVGAYTAD